MAHVITQPWIGVPVDPIVPEDPVSAGWKRFIQINADHFQKVRR